MGRREAQTFNGRTWQTDRSFGIPEKNFGGQTAEIEKTSWDLTWALQADVRRTQDESRRTEDQGLPADAGVEVEDLGESELTIAEDTDRDAFGMGKGETG